MQNTHIFDQFADGKETQQIKDNLFLDMVTLYEDYDEEMLYFTRDIDELSGRKVFLEGVASYLGKSINTSAEELLAEVKMRYKEKGIELTRTVKTWFQKKDTSPSADQAHRHNLYDFCVAMGMDYYTTAEFFFKSFLTIPFNYKDRDDAIYFYCLKNNRPYSVIKQMRDLAKNFETTNTDIAHTEEIGIHILDIESDEEFLAYLRKHCYDKSHQYATAKRKLSELVVANKKIVPGTGEDDHELLFDDLGTTKTSALLGAILGYHYQSLDSSQRKQLSKNDLPTFPRDGDIDKAIADGSEVSFETLRKSLILMKFYNFYRSYQINEHKATIDDRNIAEYLEDFRSEINSDLAECGFVQMYVRNPYDWIILHCANSPDPVYFLQDFIAKRYRGIMD